MGRAATTNSLNGIYVSPHDGNVYVASVGGDEITVHDPQNGKVLDRLGPERGGIPAEARSLMDASISIAMEPGVDSLSVGAAAAVIVTLALFGRLVEGRYKRSSTAILRSMSRLLPSKARGEDRRFRDVSTFAVGDRIRVETGETVPLDGRLIDAASIRQAQVMVDKADQIEQSLAAR